MDIRFRSCVVVIGVSLVCAVACSSPQPGQPSTATRPPVGPHTKVVDYQPWVADGLAPGIHESTSGSGNCFTTSIASSRADAYRCEIGSDLFDPCFAPQTDNQQVVCIYPSPFSVTLIHLDQPLPAPNPDAAPDVLWLLVLANGLQCVALTGAGEMVNGLRSSYACGPQGGLTFGDPDRNSPQWTIYYQPDGSQKLTPVAITTAYR